MRKSLSLATAALFCLLVATIASGAVPNNSFAVGSAKTETDAFIGVEYCPSAPTTQVPADSRRSLGRKRQRRLQHADAAHEGRHRAACDEPTSATAYFAGPVAWATDGMGNPILPPNPWAQFDILDGDQLSTQTEVTLDAFQFDGFLPPKPCRPPGSAFGRPLPLRSSGRAAIRAPIGDGERC